MPYIIAKITMRICPRTSPFAANIREETPTNPAIISKGLLPKNTVAAMASIEKIQRQSSFLVRFLTELIRLIFINSPQFLDFIQQKSTLTHLQRPNDVQRCICSTHATRWQQILIYAQMLSQFCRLVNSFLKFEKTGKIC